MTVSVIVPLYKGKKFVKIIIEMILRNKEVLDREFKETVLVNLIFVNDYPAENIEKSDMVGLDCTLLHHTQNEGIHKSRVDGLKEAEGDFVMFLDQDDSISDDYLLTQLRTLHSTNTDWVICNGLFRTSRRIFSSEQAVENVLDEKHYFSDLTEIVSPGQVLIRKKEIPDTWIDNILRNNYCDDAFLWLLLKNKGSRLSYNESVSYFHNEDGNNTSFSWKNNAEALRELKQVVLDAKCLKDESEKLFCVTVDREINKQDTFGRLEEIYALFRNRNISVEINYLIKGHSIVIYGYGIWGRRIYKLLKKNGVDVKAVIDRNIEGTIDGVMVCPFEEVSDHVLDINNCLVVFTPILNKDSIAGIMKEIGLNDYVTIVEMFEIIYSMVSETQLSRKCQ